jgi:NADH-quinone oxidoreductase subunit M
MTHMLSLLIFFPTLAAVAIVTLLVLPLSKDQKAQYSRFIAVAGSAVPLVGGIWLWFNFSGDVVAQGPLHYVERVTWIQSMGIEYFVGVDGISVSMVILSTLISFVATLASMPWWRRADEHSDPAHPHFSEVKVPGYMIMLLILQTGMTGTFAAADMFLFFVFWEVMLLPMYFLIGIWGGPRKEYAAIKFFLFTLAGSVLLLLAIIAIYYKTGDQSLLQRFARFNPAGLQKLAGDGVLALHDQTWQYQLGDGTWTARTFDLMKIAKLGQNGLFDMVGPFLGGITFAKLMWVFMFIAFAVKVPMVPLHTWLPDAHVEAPTPISVILAGVLLKMGIYGMLRFNWAVLPSATSNFADVVAVFGVINIVYAAMVCLAQKDLKKLIAYSSVSHMGFSLLGMSAMTEAGMSGAVLNLFTHGIISPMLFLIVGVIYDRAHHREIEGFGGIAKVVPEYTGLVGLAFFASLGLPGLAGFVSEFLVLNGSFATWPWFTAISATSVIITAAYYLWTIQRMFLGKLNDKYAHLPDVNWRERLTLYPLGALALVFGFYPNVMLSLINKDLYALVSAVKHV